MRNLILAVLTVALPSVATAQMIAWTYRPLDEVRGPAPLIEPRLRESSGVARSTTLPGVLYTINDSGNDPIVFATDTSGRATGAWTVPGVANRDWETIAVGPCPDGSCMYLGDTGDNAEARPFVVVYRVAEPHSLARFTGGTDATPIRLDSLVLKYPDGSHDVEAMYLDNSGTLYLVSKGRTNGIALFRVPANAWLGSGVVTAERWQELPIVPNRSAGIWVTDAARSPDGRHVAVRTYTTIYIFDVAPDGKLRVPANRTGCDVGGMEPQGEGIEWLDNRYLVLTSEASSLTAGTIYTVRCGP
jgi:hypothetical protein